MDDSAGDQETTDSACVTEDEDDASTTGDDDERKCSEGFPRKDKELTTGKLKCLEATNSVGKNGDERRISAQDDQAASSEDRPRKGKEKERARIDEREDSRSENMQDTTNCSFCMDPIRESPIYVIYHIRDPEPMEQGYPVCSHCLQGLQTTYTFQSYSASITSTADSPQALPTATPSTPRPEYQTPTTSRPNLQGRKRVCESLFSRRQRWRARRVVLRERSRQLCESTDGKPIGQIGRTRRAPRTFDQDVTGKSDRIPQSSGITEQGFVGRTGTGSRELLKNRLRKRVSYTSKKREIRFLEMLLKRARARLVRIRGQRAIVPVLHHTPSLEHFPSPLASSSTSLSHSHSPLKTTQNVHNSRLESESRGPSISASRPIYMGPPPSEAGPSNLNYVARPDTRSQVYFVSQSPVRAARSNNSFFGSPETYPSQMIWQNDEDEKTHE